MQHKPFGGRASPGPAVEAWPFLFTVTGFKLPQGEKKRANSDSLMVLHTYADAEAKAG